MLAWSRWQLGWLEPSQIRCIEFRFVIDKGLVSASPLILEIGDITDITRRFDFAELNGEEFLGGEMAVPE